LISLNRAKEREGKTVSFPSPEDETLRKKNLTFAEHLLRSFLPTPINLISPKGEN